MLKNSLLEEQDIVRIRTDSSGSYNEDGDWVSGTETTETIKCIVQPYRNGSSQFILPEGVKSEDTRVVYSKSDLRNTSEHYKYVADILIIDDLKYQVQQVSDYSKYIKSITNLHYQCLAVQVSKAATS